jgi:peptidoglycan/xylan/chitin deacetylase (PgdA/CDA1 family)
MLDTTEANTVVNALVTEWGRETGSAHRALTAGEITGLASDPLIEIGGHTVHHPVLAELSRERQRDEIVNNRLLLETLTGRTIRSFSYPHGSFNDVTRDVVRESGIAVACCSVPDVAASTSDMLALPRLWVDGNRRREFSRWVDRWLGPA